MIILDRLHRGAVVMVPVAAEQGDKNRLVFTNQAGVDAFIDAYRRADPCVSFQQYEIPDISLSAFWEACRDHDWHYANSDDHSVWKAGGSVASRLSVHKMQSDKHSRIYMAWMRHKLYRDRFPDAPKWQDYADTALGGPATMREEG